MTVLPEWEQGTAGVLCAAGPHPIPVSTAVRASDDRLLFALAPGRKTLARLREDSRAAFLLMAEGLAFTAHGTVSILREEMEAGTVALELTVERLQDHLDAKTELLSPVGWRFRTERADRTDRLVRAELARLASGLR
ncbi:MAG: hypothetical protein M3133_07225 [Actinomycetota bacterium]|nr:hypothetical protein [Actinomycetota bacterium]